MSVILWRQPASEDDMAFRSKHLEYTVYPPEMMCWDFWTITKARLAAKKFGSGARIRRYINWDKKDGDFGFQVQRVWEWDGTRFVNITQDDSKLFP
jgi:hypothetical protein